MAKVKIKGLTPVNKIKPGQIFEVMSAIDDKCYSPFIKTTGGGYVSLDYGVGVLVKTPHDGNNTMCRLVDGQVTLSND